MGDVQSEELFFRGKLFRYILFVFILIVIVSVLSFFTCNFHLNKTCMDKLASEKTASGENLDTEETIVGVTSSENSDEYAYYFNQGFDVFGKVFIKISKKILEEKGIGEYDTILVNNLCYYPFPSDPFETGKFTIADNCGAVKNSVNSGANYPSETYLTKKDTDLAREVVNFVHDSQRVLRECTNDISSYYPQDLVLCNTNWHSWLFDTKLHYASSYPTLPNYCLGISTSKSKTCFNEVQTCLTACKNSQLVRDEAIANQYTDTEAMEAAIAESAEQASKCAFACTENANACCKKEFLTA